MNLIFKTGVFALFFCGIMNLNLSNASDAKPLQDPLDTQKVKEAILDYVESVYERDTLRIYKSVHPDLVKRGTSLNRDNGTYSEFRDMTFERLVDVAENWNKDGSRANSGSVKDIEIYDVLDKTASAKVTAVWGTDYFHLAKIDGKWWIMNVLWQSHPPKAKERS